MKSLLKCSHHALLAITFRIQKVPGQLDHKHSFDKKRINYFSLNSCHYHFSGYNEDKIAILVELSDILFGSLAD